MPEGKPASPAVDEATVDDICDVLRLLIDIETPALTTYLDSRQALADSALYYAGIGWPVFPLVAGGKMPVTPNGFKDATTDPAVITEWWRTMPSANIGVPTGVRFDVIDIDAPDGFESYATFRNQLRTQHPDVLAAARTGSDGVHLLIAPQPGSRNGANFLPGLDYRATGGYIVVPPSRLHDGQRYAWTINPDSRLGA